MIDRDGYRLNVGIVLVNRQGQLFWGKRVKARGWQFPQGGVQSYETLTETMYRELAEEVGLNKEDVEILTTTKRWLRYKLPVHLQRHACKPHCFGQKQRWFLLLLTGDEGKINVSASVKPEFSSWHWVDYWMPLKQVVYFKRNIYKRVLTEFAPVVKTLMCNEPTSI